MDKQINSAMQKAISIVGSQGKLAAAIATLNPDKGCSQAAVWKWLHCEQKVPEKFVPDIVELTGGQVLAYELRPDAPKLFPPPG